MFLKIKSWIINSKNSLLQTIANQVFFINWPNCHKCLFVSVLAFVKRLIIQATQNKCKLSLLSVCIGEILLGCIIDKNIQNVKTYALNIKLFLSNFIQSISKNIFLHQSLTKFRWTFFNFYNIRNYGFLFFNTEHFRDLYHFFTPFISWKEIFVYPYNICFLFFSTSLIVLIFVFYLANEIPADNLNETPEEKKKKTR